MELSDTLRIAGSVLGFALLFLKNLQEGLRINSWEVRKGEHEGRYILGPHRILRMVFEHSLARARKNAFMWIIIRAERNTGFCWWFEQWEIALGLASFLL